MKIKNMIMSVVAAAGCCVIFAFGGDKVTLQEQMKKIDEVVADNVEAYKAKKRAACKAMALQKAIGMVEAQSLATKTTVVAPVKPGKVTTKAPVKKPATTIKAPTTTVKPATPAAPKNAEETTGRRVDPSTNTKEVQTTGRNVNPAQNAPETQTTGRRRNN
jgi:hypothetical protein